MSRQDKPVLIAADFNAVLEPLDSGIHLYERGGYSLPCDYFAGDWDGKVTFISEERQRQTFQWFEKHGLEVKKGANHTCYWRAAHALRDQDREIPADATSAVKAKVYQYRSQVCTTLIDGFAVSKELSKEVVVQSVHGGLERSQLDKCRASTELFNEGLAQGCGSDHVPVVATLGSRSVDQMLPSVTFDLLNGSLSVSL